MGWVGAGIYDEVLRTFARVIGGLQLCLNCVQTLLQLVHEVCTSCAVSVLMCSARACWRLALLVSTRVALFCFVCDAAVDCAPWAFLCTQFFV